MAILVVFIAHSSIIGVTTYRLGIKVLYGKKLQKLDEIISDLKATNGDICF